MFISTEQIKRELDVILKGKWSTRHFAGFSDHQYYAPPRQEIELYLKYNPLLLNPNSPVAGTEGFDCDDFSFALKGQIALFNRNRAHQPHSWAVGLIWGHFTWIENLHAINWIVTADAGYFLVEPQTGKLSDFSECTGNVTLAVL